MAVFCDEISSSATAFDIAPGKKVGFALAKATFSRETI
jgi:hypothetical protein